MFERLKDRFDKLMNELDGEQHNKHRYIIEFAESFLILQEKIKMESRKVQQIAGN